MRKLIIGCGYLGRRVAARWLADGHDVFALTRSERHADELRAAGIEPIIGDVTLPETLVDLPAADTLLFAVGFDRSAGDAQRTVYVDGLRHSLDALDERAKRVIYISSTSVYGQQQAEWIDESSSTTPATSGGEICLDAERLLWDFCPPDAGEAERTAVVLRLSGIYGPGRLLRRIEAVKSGTTIGGNPDGWLNLIHVDDAAAAVCACDEKAPPGTTCLVSDDQPLRRREYYERLAELLGAEPPAFETADASHERRGKRCRNRRLREEIGLVLQYPTIETGLPDAVGES